MQTLASFEFIDYHNLTDPEILEVIKELCEFENVQEPFIIDIISKSHYKKTITYKVKIYDLSSGA